MPYHPRLQAELDFSYRFAWRPIPLLFKRGFLGRCFVCLFSSGIHGSFTTCLCRRKRICLQLFICDDICKLVFLSSMLVESTTRDLSVSLRYPLAFFIAIVLLYYF